MHAHYQWGKAGESTGNWEVDKQSYSFTEAAIIMDGSMKEKKKSADPTTFPLLPWSLPTRPKWLNGEQLNGEQLQQQLGSGPMDSGNSGD